ncbi:MAG: tetratricopeptide repeat protein [Candidatus Gastranaerophilaceae bacterium]
MTDYKKFLDEGIAEIHKGNFEKGIEKINQSIDLKNDWEIPYFYRAVAYHSLEKYDEAMLDYSKSIQLNEKMTDAHDNRARISLTRKDIQNPDIKKAVEDLEKALELDEKFLDALYAIAAAHKKLGNYQTALNYLDKLIKIEPDAINAKALKKLIQQKYL